MSRRCGAADEMLDALGFGSLWSCAAAGVVLGLVVVAAMALGYVAR